ncbi:phosphoglycerate dehydrogenase [Arthrobacter psychrolactophilus]|uniref:phosphoglycerate dehydrogenase n=1 Tax=Arthrobacter psychrolactophilus TaxID=92442 RepID=UPI0015E8D3CA|nr:phosphoglycerate dehydrogenase [Arthrobacter psychrolactophilus]
MTQNKEIFLGPSYYRDLLPEGSNLLQDHGYSLVENNTDDAISPEELRKMGHDLHGAIVGMETWDAAGMDAHPNLKILSKCGVGVDKIDLKAARERGILVTNTPGLNSNAVAEVAVGLMINIFRQLSLSQEAAKSGDRTIFNGPELTGKTVGLVGMGSVGAHLVRRLKGFDVQVKVYDPYLALSGQSDSAFELCDLATVLSSADVVSLHAPLTDETHHMINADSLALFKRGSYLVNTARGGLVDESALYAALTNGQLAGAALDVFEVEPLDPNNPLLALSNVVSTTHLGANSFEALTGVGLANAHAVIDTFSGLEPANMVSSMH